MGERKARDVKDLPANKHVEDKRYGLDGLADNSEQDVGQSVVGLIKPIRQSEVADEANRLGVDSLDLAFLRCMHPHLEVAGLVLVRHVIVSPAVLALVLVHLGSLRREKFLLLEFRRFRKRIELNQTEV